METSYKLSDFAKDMGVSQKDILELLEEKGVSKKKTITVLEENEANFLIDYYTLKNQVKSLSDYLAQGSTAKQRLEKERQAEKDRKLAEQAALLEMLRGSGPAPEKKEQPKAETKKAEPKVEKKAEPKVEKKAEPKVEKKAEPKVEKKAEPKAETKKTETKKAEPKVEKKAEPKKEEKSEEKISIPPKPQKKEKTGPAPNRGPAAIRKVDTRVSNVNIERYNEKYENIAPANVMQDNMQRKQKIKQKSQDYRRPQNAKRETEADKLRRLQLEKIKKTPVTVTLGEETTVAELAAAMKKTAAEVIKELMKLGMLATITQTLDYETAAIVATEMGCKVEREVVVTIEERIMDMDEDAPESLKPRSPIVVVMGHVDHGKTSLLDAIRNSKVTAGEAGGITQHIGAYRVNHKGNEITFLDTPGHAAFTAMRQRGAMATDIAVLVVAADDGLMPQTIEAINHAKAAEVQIIVAINKMDKPEANPDRVKQQLTEHALVPEEWGGDIICVPVSALTHQGIDELLQNILLVAEMSELKANPDRKAKGVVIEARLDKGRGPVATLLVQAGTLHTGDIVVAGTSVGRVRVMSDEYGKPVKTAGPSVPVEITGLDEVPAAGDNFDAVSDERLARQLVEQRKEKLKNDQFNAAQKVTLDNLFSQLEQGELKDLNIIVKADVQGSVEAVRESVEKLTNEEVRVRVIHGAVGAINESDVMLAGASGAIIVGFNVKADPVAKEIAEREGVDIRLYRIIYNCIEELESAMKGMLAPKFREVDLGQAEVRMTYKVSGVGTIAGCYVQSGKITRNAQIRLVRDGIIVAVDKIGSLRRFKDDVKEVNTGYECGISLEKYADIKEGDIFEAFEMQEYRD